MRVAATEKQGNAAALALRRQNEYSVAFRAKVGQAAAVGAKSNPDAYLRDVLQKFFNVSLPEWSHGMPVQDKEKYREARAEAEKLKKSIARLRQDWEAGKLKGMETAAPGPVRVAVGGPPPRAHSRPRRRRTTSR